MCGCVAGGCAVFLALLRGGVAVFFASLRVCARVVAWSRVPVCVRVWVCVGGPRLCARPPLGGVLWRFPTLPHPLGCSTIGAAGLSFQVRYVAGRFPGAVTTTSLCRPPPLLARGLVWRGGGWVGRGSYSGCGSSVPPPCCRVLARVRGPGGGGGCLVARPPRAGPCSVCGAGGPWSSSLLRC